MSAMPLEIVVITTGGTIASTTAPGAGAGAAPGITGAGLLADVEVPHAHTIRIVDLFAKDSSALGLGDAQAISDAVAAAVAEPCVAGAVVVHGTDSMEETALLLHLQHRTDKPIVLTGAFRTADDPEPDGPANLAAALRLAAQPRSGVRVWLGEEYPAPGLFKARTDAFAVLPDVPRPPHLPGSVAATRVDVVTISPGGDATHLDASVAAGADGIVLVALGSGNASPEVVAGVRRAVAAGVPVVLTSRVPVGALHATYGGGGGAVDLLAAGAVHSTHLRAAQARVLLAALLSSDPDATRRLPSVFTAPTGATPDSA